jgi:conserved hypothetical protein YidD
MREGFAIASKDVLRRIQRAIRRGFIFPIRLYKRYLSPRLPDACRFEPTCSVYAMEAIEKRGVIVGIGLAIWRILRCNPYSKGGYDPVPLKKKHRHASVYEEDAFRRDEDPNASEQ